MNRSITLKFSYFKKRYLKILITISLLALILTLLYAVNINIGKIYGTSPDLIASYDFNGNLLDSLSGSILTAFGKDNDGNNHNNATSGFSTDSGIGGDTTFWQWTSTLQRGGGFVIDVNSAVSSNYSIGVRFAFNQTGPSWKKIIDYKNMTTDDGFYFYYEKLKFYPIAGEGTTVIPGNQIVDIIATRDSTTKKFTAYFVVDGTLYKELEVDDTSDLACPILIGGKTRFGFFFDDTRTLAEATNSGKVYSVKIWNGPITQLQAETAMDPEETTTTTQAPVQLVGNASPATTQAPAATTSSTVIEQKTIRTNPMTCWMVWVNEKNNFQFIYLWEYASNNWIKIYDMGDNLIYEKNFNYGEPVFEVALPNGFYKVKTFHDSDEPIQEFVIGKP